MKRKLFFIITNFVFIFLISNASQSQTTLSAWDFEAYPSGFTNPSPSIGTGLASLINQSGSISAGGTQGGNGNATGCGTTQTGSAWQVFPFDPGTFNESNGVEFKTSTVGYGNIIFKWDQRWSNTAANTERLQYTLDGTTWVNFIMTNSNTTYCNGLLNANGTYEAATPGDSFRRFIADFTLISGVANNPNFGIRLLASYYQSLTEYRATTVNTDIAGTMGAWRFDNIAFTGSLLAGPTGAVITADSSTICGGSSFNLSVAITGGSGPFILVYSDGVSNFTVPNYLSGTNVPITPAVIGTKIYTIISIQNAPAVIGISNFGTGFSGAPNVTTKIKPTFTAINKSACPGSLNLTTLCISGINPSGGTATLINTATGLAVPSAAFYSGPTITFLYTYTFNGCSTSATIIFTRLAIPSIITPPSTTTQTVCQGDSFPALNVAFTQSPTSYTWYRNTTASNIGGTPLIGAPFLAEIAAGANTANFTPLSNVIGTYYYYCRATNSCGTSTSSPISGAYTVVAPPNAGIISTTQTICSGSSPNDLTLSGQIGTITKWQKADDLAFTINVVDIANTSTTLTSAAIGNLNQSTYFRAFVTNTYCTRTTTPIQILIKTTNYYTIGGWDNGLPDSTTTAIFHNDYVSSTDLNACKVIIASGNVKISTSNSLVVQNQIDTTGGTLTFENNASLVQPNNVSNLVGVTTGGNLGNIIYKRNSTTMNVYDYTYWSSPVFNQNLFNFSPSTMFDKYYYWDTTASVYNWSTILNGATSMNVGKGYIVRSPLLVGSAPAIFTGIFSGVPNNGDINIPIEVSGALNVNNLNLIGNPYPSAIDATMFLNTNGSILNKTIYLWSHNTPITGNIYTPNDYATFDLTGAVGTLPANNSGINNNLPSGNIASGQAFFIEGINNGNAVFNNSMRILGNNSNFYKNSSQLIEKNRLWLELSNVGGAFSQTLLGYLTGATNGKDNGYDSKLFDENATASFYSLIDNEKMTIKGNALPFNENDINAMGFISKAATNYEIKLALTDGLFDNQNIYLQDNLLNLTHDLKQNSYNFFTEIGTFNDRFILKFINNSLANNENVINENNFLVFNDKGELNVQSNKDKINSVSIFDISGRLLFDAKEINKNVLKINNIKSIRQVLMVQIKTNDEIIVIKKIIY
jgi:hypothetical protein